MAEVARLYRHPIKALGVEALDAVTLIPGQAMPWDRVWGLAHQAAKLDGGWVKCMNFIRGAAHAPLMAITARLDETAARVTLSHPDLCDLTVDPDTEGAAIVDWVRPLCDQGRAAPDRIYRADQALTDSPFPSIAVLSLASLRELEREAGRPLDPRRFRGNIWMDGAAPWAEFDWIGREIVIGDARLVVRERITRCKATSVDPATGHPDTDILALLEAGWGHQDFGIYAEVVEGGRIAIGDKVAP